MPSKFSILAMNDDKIEAIDMVVDPISCIGSCNVTITVTWKNTGSVTAKFLPGISVNGAYIRLAEIKLHKDETTVQTFNLNNLGIGTYIICPDPN